MRGRGTSCFRSSSWPSVQGMPGASRSGEQFQLLCARTLPGSCQTSLATFLGWRDESVVESICCFSGGPEFHSQHPRKPVVPLDFTGYPGDEQHPNDRDTYSRFWEEVQTDSLLAEDRKVSLCRETHGPRPGTMSAGTRKAQLSTDVRTHLHLRAWDAPNFC